MLPMKQIIDQYKLLKVKEEPLSNILPYLEQMISPDNIRPVSLENTILVLLYHPLVNLISGVFTMKPIDLKKVQ